MQLETGRHIVWMNRRHLQALLIWSISSIWLPPFIRMIELAIFSLFAQLPLWNGHLKYRHICSLTKHCWSLSIIYHMGAGLGSLSVFWEHEMDKEPQIMHNRIAPYCFLKTHKMFQSHCHPNMLVEKTFHTARGSCLGAAGLIRYSWYSTISTIF